MPKLILLLLLFCYCGTSAQQRFETYTPANGLADARITKIVQDKWGRLIFLTRDGVSIFDGQSISSYTSIGNRPIGIVNSYITNDDGDIILVSFNGDWIRCDKDGLHPEKAPVPAIREISDALPYGKNWLLFSNKGIYDLQQGKVQQLTTANPAGTALLAFTGDVSQYDRFIVFNRWQKNKSVIYCYDRERKFFTDSLRLVTFSIKIAPDSNIFLASVKGLRMLNRDALSKGKLVADKITLPGFFETPDAISNIIFDNQGNYWLIGSFGCYRIDLKTGAKKLFSESDGLLRGVTSLYQDRENNLWFIAPGKGVQKLIQNRFEQVSMPAAGASPHVFYTASDEKKDIFFVTEEHMLLQKKNGVQSILVKGSKPATPVFYWNNDYWFFKDPQTLQNGREKKFTVSNLSLKDNIFQPAAAQGIDASGNLLLTGTGFLLLKPDLKMVSAPIPYYCDNVVESSPGHYWLFCRNNDVVHFELKADSLRLLSTTRVPDLSPRFGLHWNKDSFWIATRTSGIVLAKVNDKGFTTLGRINRAIGLSNDFVLTLLRTAKNQVAAGTASGLDIISINSGDTLIENAGSRNNQFEPVSRLLSDEQGMLYALNESNILLRYNPKPIPPNGFDPQVWLKQVQVNGKLYDEKDNSFGYTENNFAFSVAAPSFTDTRNILYLFELKGKAPGWRQLSNKPDFSISNLPPGNYDLQITVKFPGRIYPDKTIEYHFTIHPAFWKRWWFISLAVLITALIVFLSFRNFYTRKLERQRLHLEKQQAIEKERNRISRDMHDDLGSGLTKIAILSEVVKKQLSEPEKAKKQLEKIAVSSRELVDNLQDIIWVLNPANDTLESLSSYVREYGLKYFEPVDVQVVFDYPSSFSNRSLSEELRRNVFLAIKETFTNIAKHASANTVTVSIGESAGKVMITIADDGRGFDLNEVRTFANGLKNMQNRIAQAGGSYRIESVPGKGTVTSISFTA